MNTTGKRLTNYLYIDESRVRDAATQLNLHRTRERSNAIDTTVGLMGVGVGSKQSVLYRDATIHEMIARVVERLTAQGEVTFTRPNSYEYGVEDAPEYVLESMTAVKVIIPTSKSSVVPGLRNLAVWVSEPVEPLIPSDDVYEKTENTFLYLVEPFWEDDNGYSNGISCFTALDFIVRAVAEPLALDEGWYRHDPHSWDRSPRDILAAIGGRESRPRRIRSLYYKRYLSDDQVVRVGSGQVRCYDILGYPLFIAAQ